MFLSDSRIGIEYFICCNICNYVEHNLEYEIKVKATEVVMKKYLVLISHEVYHDIFSKLKAHLSFQILSSYDFSLPTPTLGSRDTYISYTGFKWDLRVQLSQFLSLDFLGIQLCPFADHDVRVLSFDCLSFYSI